MNIMWKKIVKNFILENKKIIQNIDLHIQPNFLIFYLFLNYQKQQMSIKGVPKLCTNIMLVII